MRRFRYDIMIVLVCLAIAAGIHAGWFNSLDNALRDARFAASMRPATGQLVLVDVDAASVERVGPLPWSRAVYADIVDRLVDAGADHVVLGLDLSAPTTPAEDARLAEAIGRAGGHVHATAQLSLNWSENGPRSIVEMPLPMFTAVARPVLLSGLLGMMGEAREYPVRREGPDGPMLSAAAELAGATVATPDRFVIDYGIDVASIPNVSAIDLLRDDANLAGLYGTQVFVGVSADALTMRASRSPQGMVTAGQLQMLAAESILQRRTLSTLGSAPVITIVLAVGFIFAFMRKRLTIGSAIAGALAYSALLEFLAFALHVNAGLLLDTAAIHVAEIGFIFAAFAHELDLRNRTIGDAARERDSMRGILTRIVADNFDGVVVVDANLRIRAASRLAEDLIAPDLAGQSIDHLLPERFQKAVRQAIAGQTMGATEEVTITCADGAPRLVEFVVTLSDVSGPEIGRDSAGAVVCLTFRDVTERHQVQERMAYLAGHDATTGAASRTRLIEIARSLLESPAGRRRGANLLLVAPSRLKTVNDTLGHDYGDRLLAQIVTRLNTTDAACVARLEGNGFAVLRAGTLSDEEGRAYADHVLAILSEPYALDAHYAIIGCNAGMTDTVRSGHAAETLVAHANMALSVATDLPGDNWAMFTAEMDSRVKHKQDMEVALRAALSNGEFSVHYQPQVDLDTGEIIGVEALTRWNHPELGNVSPAMFIPAAEETGLIIELGRWVLHTACREVVGWPEPITLSVNVSPMQFEFGNVVADVRSALAASGLQAKRLTIEITESLLITETSRFTRQLETLRGDGVQVALDDFGTGYSSLSYLGRLPVDKIKIDQSFVRGLPDDAEATAIIRAVLMLSESLGKDVVAEGIETADQAWMLRLAGCRIGQGFYFGRPAIAADIIAQLDAPGEDRMPGSRIAG